MFNKIINEFNDTKVDYDRNKTMIQSFEESADKNADKIALYYKNRNLTYAQLSRRAGHLAQLLVHQRKKPIEGGLIALGHALQNTADVWFFAHGRVGMRTGSIPGGTRRFYTEERKIRILKIGECVEGDRNCRHTPGRPAYLAPGSAGIWKMPCRSSLEEINCSTRLSSWVPLSAHSRHW